MLARGELNLCWATLCDHSSRPAGNLSKQFFFKDLKKKLNLKKLTATNCGISDL